MTREWAIVTGATSGIGLECAKDLAKRQYNLVLAARSPDVLKKLETQFKADGIDVLVVETDLSTSEGATKLVHMTDTHGITPKILVNNAGIGVHGKFLEMPLEDYLKMLQLNVNSLVSLTHIYGGKMKKNGGGRILQVASTGAFQPLPYYGLYAATKSLVLSFSYAFNFEHADDGVTSTALCPGPTKTSFFDNRASPPSKHFDQLMMNADVVAKMGIEGMLSGKDLVIPGAMNITGAVLGRFIPRKFLLKSMGPLIK